MFNIRYYAMSVTSSTLPPGIGLIEVSGALLGGEEISQLRDAVQHFLDQQCERLIIDLDGVTHMNSVAVGVMVSALTSYARRKWRIRLCAVNKTAYSVLAIVKLNLVFDMDKTREQAIKSLAS